MMYANLHVQAHFGVLMKRYDLFKGLDASVIFYYTRGCSVVDM